MQEIQTSEEHVGRSSCLRVIFFDLDKGHDFGNIDTFLDLSVLARP